MLLKPEKFADRGCWISDDRVYAFVSAGDNCVGEIGYHGPQPVSRNSRVFVGRPSVLGFLARTGRGRYLPVAFDEFDWYAAGVRIKSRCGPDPVVLEICACGDALLIAVSAEDSPLESLCITVARDAFFRGVHGERTWSAPLESPGWWTTSFRDRVLLNEWLKRTGPYAGDFLLPEPLRRQILTHRVRSGLATIEDVHPDYRDAPIPVYDAKVSIRIGGHGFAAGRKGENVLLTASLLPGRADFPPLGVYFSSPERDPARTPGTVERTREHYQVVLRQAPVLVQPGYPRLEEFFPTVPALVESCIIRDHGVPRATPGRYYWVWAWDAMVTALSAHRWGAGSIARRTVEFVDSHRDGEEIPMRWTRALDPLDSRPRGALETLLASLAYVTAIETGNAEFLRNLYPRLIDHLRGVTASADPRGFFANIGFYPDLPRSFGRTDSSAVALEIGCFYSFCRTIENIAHLMEDPQTAGTAAAAADLLEKEFCAAFWDSEAGFLCDAIDLDTGRRNLKHPLFSLLFLHSPLGWPLVRKRIGPLADFISRRLLTGDGMRVLPAGESSSETVSNAWYPHWDLYALRVLRRAGRTEDILRWLACVERALARLGFCPEYIALDAGPAHANPEAEHHGAPSNLNCVTGWYQALLEGVVGLEHDPGGLTIIPLYLPLGDCSLRGVAYRGTRWNVTVRNGGEKLQSITVDGVPLHGCLKIPFRYLDGGEHGLLLTYGEEEQAVMFREIANAEVLDARERENCVQIDIRARGRCDVIYSAPEGWRLMLDGNGVSTVRRLPEGTFEAQLAIVGVHTLRLTPLRGTP